MNNIPKPSPVPEPVNPQDLAHIYWLGGSPCSGKSSISRRLARRSGLGLYSVDEALPGHLARLDPHRHPTLDAWVAASWDDRWLKPVEVLVAEAYACYREHFTLVLEDLLATPRETPLLVEGTALLPSDLAGLGIPARNAVWVVPTREFQNLQYSQRSWVNGILSECSQPETAFSNWMERDAQFAGQIKEEVTAAGYPLLMVDGQASLEENTAWVAARFGLGPTSPDDPLGS